MRNAIKQFLERNRRVVKYLFFGMLTTAVSYFIYFPLYNLAGYTAALSNGLSWVAAVVFAFFTNKPFVFESKNWGISVIIPEFLKFAALRLGSGLAETFLIWLTVDILLWNGNVMKLVLSVLVVILNYFASKYIVFRR